MRFRGLGLGLLGVGFFRGFGFRGSLSLQHFMLALLDSSEVTSDFMLLSEVVACVQGMGSKLGLSAPLDYYTLPKPAYTHLAGTSKSEVECPSRRHCGLASSRDWCSLVLLLFRLKGSYGGRSSPPRSPAAPPPEATMSLPRIY